VERFGNKPNGPKISCNKQIQEFRTKQTQATYLACNLSVTAEIGPFFGEFKCERPIKDSRLMFFHAAPIAYDIGLRFKPIGY